MGAAGKRRGNGQAEPFKDASGRWTVFVELPRADDGRRRRKKITADTKTESVKLAAAARAQIETTGSLPDETVTVSALMELYLGSIEDRVRPGSLSTYSMWSRLYVVPFLGRRRIAKLTPAHIRAWHKQLRDAGHSPNTVRAAHRVLRQALAMAERDGLVSRNVAKVEGGPRGGEHRKVAPLTPDEVTVLLGAVEGWRYEALVWVLVGCGLRIGEALGLRWCDVDLDGGTLTVAGQLQDIAGQGKVRVDLPKTESSMRTVAMGARVRKKLIEHRRRAAEERLLYGAGPIPERSPVFTNPLTVWADRANIAKELKKLATGAGVAGVHFHRLRHSHAAIAIDAGIDLKALADQLGHRTIATTANTYGSMFDAGRQRVADAVDVALGS
jgi:integrase